MTNPILNVLHISKTIKKKEIIKDISFQLKKGEILGFLGPNGAGKSTTLRMIVGLSKPCSGEITICGHSITKNYVAAMSHVGCIIEGPDLYNYMTGYQNLELLGSMSTGVSKADIDHAIRLVGMENRIHDQVGIYSMGMKQRIGLAQALIHKPDLLILDEPTNGLDPQGIHEFREIVKSLAKDQGISVLISSHLIGEVQLMCDKACIINNGIIIQDGLVAEMLSTGEFFWLLNQPLKGQEILKNDFEIDGVINDQNELIAQVDANMLAQINAAFIGGGLELQTVYPKHKTLEDLFLTVTDQRVIG